MNLLLTSEGSLSTPSSSSPLPVGPTQYLHLLDSRSAFFWTEISDVGPGICWSDSLSLGVTALSIEITRGTTVTFTFLFCSSSFSPWYFSRCVRECSFFLMLQSLLAQVADGTGQVEGGQSLLQYSLP